MVSNAQLQSSIESFQKSITESISELKQSNEKSKTELISKIDSVCNKIKVLEERVDLVTSNVEVLTQRVENDIANHDIIIERLRLQIVVLQDKVEDLSSLKTQVDENTEKTEERTNRQLRETLIFKNIDEGKEEVTYDDTKNLLAKVISMHTDVSFEDVFKDIKRAHREAKKKPRDGKSRDGKRHIYVAFHSWDLPQKCIEVFRQKNINDRSFKISAEQKYGPITTKRRNLAFKLRRELIDNKTISSAYVAFPARLMISNSTDAAGKKLYKCHTDFSTTLIE